MLLTWSERELPCLQSASADPLECHRSARTPRPCQTLGVLLSGTAGCRKTPQTRTSRLWRENDKQCSQLGAVSVGNRLYRHRQESPLQRYDGHETILFLKLEFLYCMRTFVLCHLSISFISHNIISVSKIMKAIYRTELQVTFELYGHFRWLQILYSK